MDYEGGDCEKCRRRKLDIVRSRTIESMDSLKSLGRFRDGRSSESTLLEYSRTRWPSKDEVIQREWVQQQPRRRRQRRLDY